jgi:hypothetical protein
MLHCFIKLCPVLISPYVPNASKCTTELHVISQWMHVYISVNYSVNALLGEVLIYSWTDVKSQQRSHSYICLGSTVIVVGMEGAVDKM